MSTWDLRVEGPSGAWQRPCFLYGGPAGEWTRRARGASGNPLVMEAGIFLAIVDARLPQ